MVGNSALSGPMLMMQLLVEAKKKMSFFSKPSFAETMMTLVMWTRRTMRAW